MSWFAVFFCLLRVLDASSNGFGYLVSGKKHSHSSKLSKDFAPASCAVGGIILVYITGRHIRKYVNTPKRSVLRNVLRLTSAWT